MSNAVIKNIFSIGGNPVTKNKFGIRSAISFSLVLLFICSLAVPLNSISNNYYGVSTEEATETDTEITVVIDAGHGGEDGGAVGVDGSFEKDLNLNIAFLLRDMLESNGIRTVLTRDEDILLYDRNVDYHGRKKVLDLAARLKIGKETENSVFVSIHMNSFPQQQYSGLQVWYSPNDSRSAEIAENVRKNVVSLLQEQNTRKIKPASSNIFLLNRLESPAILIECGFISNPTECSLLNTQEYRKQLAFAIFASISEFISETDVDF